MKQTNMHCYLTKLFKSRSQGCFSRISALVLALSIILGLFDWCSFNCYPDNRNRAFNTPVGKKYHSEIWWKAKVEDDNESPDTRLAAIDSLSRYTTLSTGMLLTKGKLLKETGDMVQAAELYGKIIDEHPNDLDEKKLLDLKIDYLYMLQSIGRNSTVLKRAHEFLSQPISDSLLHLELPIRMFMVNGALTSGRLNIARQYLDEAAVFCKTLKGKVNKKSLNYATNQALKGEILYAIHSSNFERALHLVDSARSIFPSESKENFLDMCAPIVYDGMGEKKYAEELYRKTLSLSLTPDIYLANLNNFANFLINNSKPDEALDLIDSNIEQPQWIRKHPTFIRLMAIKGDALGLMGDYKQAYEYLSEYKAAMDSIYAQERQDDALLGIEQLKINNKFEEEKRHSHSLTVGLWVVVWLAVLLVVVGIAMSVRMRSMNENLKKVREELLAIDTRHQEKLNASVEKIERQQRELVGKELQMAKMSGAIAHIKEVISDSDMADPEKLSSMKSALRDFSADKDVWEMFRIYFEMTHPDFIRNLYRVCPEITPKEIRMCAFVLMNLTTKEIANITRRVPRSVETMKYRLSKKLGLPSGETLNKYLESLSVGE